MRFLSRATKVSEKVKNKVKKDFYTTNKLTKKALQTQMISGGRHLSLNFCSSYLA